MKAFSNKMTKVSYFIKFQQQKNHRFKEVLMSTKYETRDLE